jgi:hypothetical protein
MTKISHLHRRWSKDADYKDAYEALGEEFDLARADRGADGRRAVAVAAGPADEDLAVVHRAHRGRQGPSVNRRSGTLRSGDTHASADRLRTARYTLIRRWRRRGFESCLRSPEQLTPSC